MRKITISFVVPEECEDDYRDVCAQLVVEDLLGIECLGEVGFEIVDDTNPPKEQ